MVRKAMVSVDELPEVRLPNIGTVRDVATFVKTHPSNIPRLVANEGLPSHVLSIGPKGRRSLRFNMDEVAAWLDSRRERQVVATLDGRRYSRRRA